MGFAFADWADATGRNWGPDRTNVAAEKPFGVSTEDADDLYNGIVEILPEENLKIVDHWLSFFMIKNMPNFRGILESSLGVSWDDKSFSKIVITEHETRGLEGRGGFFDGVGQVRDMHQSHLLQLLGYLLIDPSTTTEGLGAAKLDVFQNV